MWEWFLMLVIGLAMFGYGWREARRQTTDGIGSWIFPLLFGAAVIGIALFIAVIWVLIWLAVG